MRAALGKSALRSFAESPNQQQREQQSQSQQQKPLPQLLEFQEQ